MKSGSEVLLPLLIFGRTASPGGLAVAAASWMLDTAPVRAYGVQMSEISRDVPPDPDDGLAGDEIPADVFSPTVDPDFIPDTEGSTPEEKRSREHPEETGS